MVGSNHDRDLVIAYLRSMQMGPAGIAGILDLYADDGVYVEHLTSVKGEIRTHAGKAAIREALSSGMKWNPPDLSVALDRLEIEGNSLIAHWTCTSSQFAAPMKGTDRYTLSGGKIARLETRLDASEASG
jgi:hypothetical protein